FDLLTRLIVGSGDWSAVETIPLVAPSRDFRAMKLHLEVMAAARRRDPTAARPAADQLERLAGESGQHPLAHTIITLQATEARGLAAHAPGDQPGGGDSQTARARYTEFLDGWKDADEDRPELAVAQRYLRGSQPTPR